MTKRTSWLIAFFILFSVNIALAQNCVKGQSVTFAQLPNNPHTGASCLTTDVPYVCTAAGTVVTVGGGNQSCMLQWSGTNWIISRSQAPAAAATPSLSGGGTLDVGANSQFGIMSNLANANNVLTPGVTCLHKTVCIFEDDGTGGIKQSSPATATTVTFSAQVGDKGGYTCGCE